MGRVLVVDDEPSMVAALGALLKACGSPGRGRALRPRGAGAPEGAEAVVTDSRCPGWTGSS